jgi:hypothetical protein
MAKNIADMTDEELWAYIDQLQKEAAERKTRAAVNQQVADVIQAARAGSGITHTDGDEWVKPISMLTAYVSGEIVHHEGAYWRSEVDGNVCVPQDQVPPPEGCGSWERVSAPVEADEAAS